MRVIRTWCCSLAVCLLSGFSIPAEAKDLRVGIIGLDTSHVVAFTKLLNDKKNPDHVAGARVIAAYPGGSPDVEASATRLQRFTDELRNDWGVKIVDDIPTLCSLVDAILLESVDGRPHLEQLRPVLAARKPVFIDKPLAGSWEDAQEIVRLVKESGVPCFSSSSLRFDPDIQGAKDADTVGEVLGCDAYSPALLEEHHPDLYWYGVHGVEILFTIMGPGCQSVRRVTHADWDLVIGEWSDGRIGTFRGLRKGKYAYGAQVFGTAGIIDVKRTTGYRPLLVEVVKFFQTGKAAVDLDETLEIFAFMSAADESKKQGGATVRIADLPGRKKQTKGSPAVEPRRKVTVAAGEIPAIEFARYYSDAFGLSLIPAAESDDLRRMITVPQKIEAADPILVKEMLAANGFNLVDYRMRTGRNVVVLQTREVNLTSPTFRTTPIVKVGGRTREVSVGDPVFAQNPVRYGDLSFSKVPAALHSHLSLAGNRGVLIRTGVEDGATKGALSHLCRDFDIIRRVEGRTVNSPAELLRELRARSDQNFTVDLLRRGKAVIVIVTNDRL